MAASWFCDRERNHAGSTPIRPRSSPRSPGSARITSYNVCYTKLLRGVGGITESDITLASASDAIVLGFNVRPEPKATSLADAEGVDIRLYNIIYDAVADIKDAMEGLLAPTMREKYLGRAEVRETFSVTKVGTIAGSYVVDA